MNLEPEATKRVVGKMCVLINMTSLPLFPEPEFRLFVAQDDGISPSAILATGPDAKELVAWALSNGAVIVTETE